MKRLRFPTAGPLARVVHVCKSHAANHMYIKEMLIALATVSLNSHNKRTANPLTPDFRSFDTRISRPQIPKIQSNYFGLFGIIDV